MTWVSRSADFGRMDITDKTSAKAQALSIPPYLFGLLIILVTSYVSDRFRSRSIPLLVLCGVSTLGYSLLVFSGIMHKTLERFEAEVADIETAGPWWQDQLPSSAYAIPHSATVAMSYTGLMLAAGCIFAIISLVITWNGNNSETESGRGTGQAIMQGLGQCGPLLGTRLYPAEHGPEYIPGSLTCAACMVVVFGLVGVQRWRLKRENLRREALDARETAMKGEREGKGRSRFMFML